MLGNLPPLDRDLAPTAYSHAGAERAVATRNPDAVRELPTRDVLFLRWMQECPRSLR
jgi:hypothetical protein